MPKLTTLLDEAETDVLAQMDFLAQHRTNIFSKNPIERLNCEIKHRSDVVGISPNEAAAIRLIGVLLLEENDGWAVQRAHYMSPETDKEALAPLLDDLRWTRILGQVLKLVAPWLEDEPDGGQAEAVFG